MVLVAPQMVYTTPRLKELTGTLIGYYVGGLRCLGLCVQ